MLGTVGLVLIIVLCVVLLLFLSGLVIYLCRKNNYKFGGSRYEKIPLKSPLNNSPSNPPKLETTKKNENPVGKEIVEKERG